MERLTNYEFNGYPVVNEKD